MYEFNWKNPVFERVVILLTVNKKENDRTGDNRGCRRGSSAD
jgi:hypothetical protein